VVGSSNEEAAQAVLEIIAVVDGWKDHFESCGITGSDIDNLADRLDSAVVYFIL
jgi:serine/threonine-protein kinase HipA